MKSALRYDALGITRVHGKPLGTAGKILVEFTDSKLADVPRSRRGRDEEARQANGACQASSTSVSVSCVRLSSEKGSQ
jgi:hypothetical protein